jgi:signal transduction histidine kinase
MDKHRGRISMRSRLGSGTVFSLWLPLVGEEQAEAKAS